MKKILVSDFDNTFYINYSDMSKNIESVKKFREAGNIFIIATGSSYGDFNKKIKGYQVEYDYLIINQGATILKKDEVIANYHIEDNIKEKLKSELNLNDGNDMFVCKELKSRVSINESKVTKIHKEFETLIKASSVNKKLNDDYGNYINSYLITNVNGIEIISSKTNKAQAIKLICELEEIKMDNVYTIGDSYNDIEMLKEFNGSCMENSEKEIKCLCDEKYSSVSNLIYKLIENRG